MASDDALGDLLMLGAFAVAGYLAWQYFSGSDSGSESASGSSLLSDLFNIGTPTGESALNNLTNSAVNGNNILGPGSGGLSAGL